MNIFRSTPRIAAAVGIGIAGLGLALSAGADVPRYQLITLSYSAVTYYVGSAGGTGYPQSITVTLNPCDGTFSGPGTAYPYNTATPSWTEGEIDGLMISYTTEYPVGAQTDYVVTVVDAVFNPADYSFSGNWSDNFAGGAQTGVVISGVPTMSSTEYRNHGDFVSANPDKNDAAHSCIGMPMQSQKNK